MTPALTRARASWFAQLPFSGGGHYDRRSPFAPAEERTMPGAATVVTYTVPDDQAEILLGRVQSLLFPAAREVPGYQGFLVLDQGDGKRMAIVLCDSMESARAVQAAIGPIAADQIYPLMSSPSIGTLSMVLARDGVFSAG
jgi:hypothetical protein